jgi:hypothetical protein
LAIFASDRPPVLVLVERKKHPRPRPKARTASLDANMQPGRLIYPRRDLRWTRSCTHKSRLVSSGWSLSALPQKRTFISALSMSALCHKPTFPFAVVPEAVMRSGFGELPMSANDPNIRSMRGPTG